MGDIKINFLGNDYIFPEVLGIYVGDLKKFEPYYEKAMELLINQMKEKTYSSGADVDFIYFRKPLKKIVEKIIKDLSNQGVYSISIKELLDDNIGYKKLWNTCNDCFQEMKRIYTNSILEYAQEYQNAYNTATSKITGLDYSILTNSPSALLTYSVLESNAVNKQIKRADKEYRARIKDLNKHNNDEMEQKENALLVNIYYPNIADAITLFVDTLFDRYTGILAANGKYDLSIINSYNIEYSSNLLQNLSLIENKQKVIQQAFEACPYNVKVYCAAIENALFDENILKIATIFQFDKKISKLLKKYCISHKDNYDSIDNAISALSNYNNEDKKHIYIKLYQSDIQNSCNSYNLLLNICNDKNTLIKWIEKNIANTSSKFIKMSDEQINDIVSTYISDSINPDLIERLINDGIINTQDVFKSSVIDNSIEKCIFDLTSNVSNTIFKYRQNVTNYVEKGLAKFEILKKQYQEAKQALESKNELLSEMIINTKLQRDSLGFFSFSKKKELDKKFEQLNNEFQSNPVKFNYIQKKQEYEAYAQELEKLI